MNTALYRFNKLKTICNIIYKDLDNYYDMMLHDKIHNEMNEHTLTALASAKEKIIELENEINNATPKTEDA